MLKTIFNMINEGTCQLCVFNTFWTMNNGYTATVSLFFSMGFDDSKRYRIHHLQVWCQLRFIQ